MNYDLIVVNGDSCCDGGGVYSQYEFENNKKPDFFKIGWAYFLSKKLNIPIVNLAVGGTSNRSIINKSLRFLENDEIYYHRDDSYPIIQNFSLNNYKNILFITQWSYIHRFPLYVKGEYKEITPSMYDGLRWHINNDVLFEKYKEYADLRFSTIYNEKSNGKNFITDYFLYNEYLSNKKNVTHYNWPYVPFEIDSGRFNYSFVINKVKSYSYKIIDNNCVNIRDLKTVRQETNDVIKDEHIGLHSCEIMADRLINFLKKEYELQQI